MTHDTNKRSAALTAEQAEEMKVRLLDYHDRLLALCDRLEEIADSLPDKVNTQECLRISRMIFPAVKETHRFEEDHVFPYLKTLAGSSKFSDSLQRLQFEHWEDESYAQEICEALVSFVARPATANPETLSYMLRGFFEGMRRHIAFELEYILPQFSPEGPRT